MLLIAAISLTVSETTGQLFITFLLEYSVTMKWLRSIEGFLLNADLLYKGTIKFRS